MTHEEQLPRSRYNNLKSQHCFFHLRNINFFKLLVNNCFCWSIFHWSPKTKSLFFMKKCFMHNPSINIGNINSWFWSEMIYSPFKYFVSVVIKNHSFEIWQWNFKKAKTNTGWNNLGCHGISWDFFSFQETSLEETLKLLLPAVSKVTVGIPFLVHYTWVSSAITFFFWGCPRCLNTI